MKKILMTGAAGGVAGFLRAQLKDRYELLLSDIKQVPDIRPWEQFLPSDIADADAVRQITQGVDGIIHLGGFAVEGPWPDIRDANIEGTYNVYEAARENGIKRVVLASSNHVIGFYERTQAIDHQCVPRPDSRYGVSKVFGEALASLYADKYGVHSMCIRIGNVSEEPADVRRLSVWISPRDLAQLVEIGLEQPDVHCEVVYGVSANDRSWWDNTNAIRLGYRPKDNSERFAEKVLRNTPAEDPEALATQYQGGAFVSAETGGDPSKPKVT